MFQSDFYVILNVSSFNFELTTKRHQTYPTEKSSLAQILSIIFYV